MFVSEELRKTNIAEYLLYMWQVEDSIRAAGLDADVLMASVAKGSGRSESDYASWRDWYQDMIDMMRREGKEEKGHLQVNMNLLEMLTDLHRRLLESEKVPEYHDAYYKALPFIVEIRTRKGESRGNELEDCFDLMYGLWMLRLQHRTISESTTRAAGTISAMIAMLASYYRKEKAGILELE